MQLRPLELKRCTVCGKDKPLSRYHLDARSPDGHRNVCMVCRMQEGRARNKAARGAGSGRAAPARQASPMFAPGPITRTATGAAGGVPDPGQDLAEEYEEGAELEIEAPEEAQSQRRGMFDSLMGAMRGENPAPSRAERGDRQDITVYLATLGGTGLSIGTKILIPDPYKPVGPSPAHGAAIVRPLAEWMAEALDVAGHIGPNVARILETLTALAAYGDYAMSTYEKIREREEARRATAPHPTAGWPQPIPGAYPGHGAGYDTRPAPPTGGASGGGIYGQAYGAGPGQGPAAGYQAFSGLGSLAPDGAGGHGAGYVGANGDAGIATKAAMVDALLNADAEGRARQGLV